MCLKSSVYIRRERSFLKNIEKGGSNYLNMKGGREKDVMFYGWDFESAVNLF